MHVISQAATYSCRALHDISLSIVLGQSYVMPNQDFRRNRGIFIGSAKVKIVVACECIDVHGVLEGLHNYLCSVLYSVVTFTDFICAACFEKVSAN